jgi:hypothetical protein
MASLASRPGAAAQRLRRLHVAPSIKRSAQVATATLVVAGLPVSIVWWLRASGTISSAAIGALVGVALSLCASQVGCVLWEKLPGSEDLLFSELMLWGFVHRWHTQRRLTSAVEMVGPMGQAQRGAAGGLSTKQQAKLLEQLVAGLETRDPYLHGHSRRVARHAWMIARRMGLPREEVARIRTAAAVHDVGKIETPKAILHRPGPLSADEFEVIKRHPSDGALMAEALHDPELTAMVRHHHERLDGTGYPGGLCGTDIPLGARIIAVADTFDAITSTRSYRPASPHKKAIDILKRESGTQLDPAVVRAFCGHYAGRRPIFIWASVAGLPERVVSWLGGGLASVASAAKILAVAVLVGGVAGTTSTLALPPAKSGSATLSAVRTVPAAPRRLVATHARIGTSAPIPGGQRARKAQASVTPSAHHRSPAALPAVSAAAIAATPSSSASVAGGTSQGAKTGANNEAHARESLGSREEPHGSGKREVPRGKSEETHAKGEVPRGKSEEPHGKSEEPHGSGKGEAPSGKSEEPHGAGKGEAPSGKSEEPHGAGKGEESNVKSEAPHGTSEEAHGKG